MSKSKSLHRICCVVCIFLMSFGCNGPKRQHENKVTPVPTLIGAAAPINYNIYIENSGSMDGYISGPSEFKDVLIDFVSDIPARLKVVPGLFFVNSTTCQQLPNKPASDLIYFIKNLNPASSKQLCPASGNSLLPNVIDLCTHKMKNSVSILVSDCIFSDKNSAGDLSAARASIKMFMAKRLAEEGNISTIVLKYNSRFTGTYYIESQNGEKQVLKNVNRPYYIMLFGQKESLATLLHSIDFKDYPGYENSYCLAANDEKLKIPAVVTYQNKTGTFAFDKPASKLIITNAKPDKDNTFQFSLNIDLSNAGYEEKFLLTPSNYVVNDGFQVVAVSKIAAPSDYTHHITISTRDLKSTHSLTVGLKYDIPDWVKKTGNVNDGLPKDTIQQHQTFGFKYLMEGISQAYEATGKSAQFIIPINTIRISRNKGSERSSGFPLWGIVFLVVIVGVIIWLKNKK